VVEGVGGWLVPLAPGLSAADIAIAWKLPVILVVGLRLGCINHALLSARAIREDGCELLGWIGNTIDPDMRVLEENLATLRALMPAPCLGVLPNSVAPIQAATHLQAAAAALG
jgi:dethiobiotin synthetase